MYIATSPARRRLVQASSADRAVRLPLPLAQLTTRAFEDARPYQEEMLGFFGDLANLYGLPYDREEFARRRRTTFTDMVTGIVDELRGEGDAVGLVVLAHSTSDSEPGWPACYLTNALPGEPLSFAIADQGVVAPFTALRIAGDYIRADDVHRAMVVVLDQRTLLRDPAAGGDAVTPTGNRVAALVLDRRGALADATVSVETDVDLDAVAPALLRAEVVVAGTRLASLLQQGPEGAAPTDCPGASGQQGPEGAAPTDCPGASGKHGPEVVPAPDGLPCTGLWSTLDGELDRWRSAGITDVLLADYDPELRCLGQCRLELRAS